MRFLLAIVMLALPMAATAEDVNSAPMVIIGDEAKTNTTTEKAVVPTPAEPAKAPAAPPVAATPPPAASATPAAEPAQQILTSFPQWAVTKAGADTAGQGANVTAAPSAPASPTPESPPKAQGAPTPLPPASPEHPNKLWPMDTVPIFLKSCSGSQPELVAPCSCVITHLMVAMPHDEFLGLTATGTLNQDQRYMAIRQGCLGPGKHSDAPPTSAQ